MTSPATVHPETSLQKEKIEAQISRGMPWLFFDDARLEAEFRRFHLNETRHGMLITLALGTVLYAGTGIIDYTSTGVLALSMVSLRLGIGIPALLLTLIVVWNAKSESLVQWAGCFGLTVSGSVVVAMLVLLPDDLQQFYIVGLTVMVFVPYCFIRLSARFALLTGLLITLSYTVAVPVFRDILFLHWIQGVYFLLLANVVGFSACYLIEYYQRRSFLAHALLEQQRAELEQVNAHLYSLSTLDPLTGVANRRHFEEFLAIAWRQSLREKQPLALIMVDLDCFKQLNDIYGHQAGDQCLVWFAGMASSHIRRPLDLIGRYGGEEFIVALSKTNEAQAYDIAEGLRTGLKALGIPHRGAPEGVMTLSAGLVSSVPQQCQEPYDFIRIADRALYQAKRGGRDRVVIGSLC